MRDASRRGTVVVAVIVALVVLQILVYAVAVAGSRDQDLTVRRLEAARSYYAAEAVANMSMREIGRNLDEDANGTIGTVFSAATPPAIGPGGASAWTTAVSAAGVTTVTASAANGSATRTITSNVQRVVTASGVQGLFVEMWAMSTGLSALSNVPWATAPGWATVTPNINMPSLGSVARWPGGPASRYGVRFRGSIIIPTTGTWSFRTSSDDGSDLWINGVRVVNNDGLHGNATATGTATLTAGTYSFECRFFENTGSSNLWAEWRGPSMASWELIPTTAFKCSPSVDIPPVAVAWTIGISGASGSPQAGVDGYNSAVGAYGSGNVLTSGVLMSTNSTSWGQWIVWGSSRVTVDGRVGPGGSASSVIAVLPPAVMTGTNGALTIRTAPMLQGLPLTLPASSGAYSSNADITISTNRRYSSFSAAGNAVITVSGNTSIIVDGALSLSGQAKFVLAPNATLDLFVGGAITLTGNSAINDSSADTARVRLYMVSTAAWNLSVNSSARVCAVVRSPFGRLVLGNSSGSTAEFFGAFHGSSLEISNNARLHADVAALPTSGSSGGGTSSASVSVKAWAQTP